MNCRERENETLSFGKNLDRGSVEETFTPWDLTISRWLKEELPSRLIEGIVERIVEGWSDNVDTYLNTITTNGVYNYEQYFGFDGVKRVTFWYPMKNYKKVVIEENDIFKICQDDRGYIMKIYKGKDISEEIKPLVTCEEDWEKVKDRARKEMEEFYTDENIERSFGRFKVEHERGDYSVRLNVPGFFWTQRDMFGIEGHLYSFYDYPEVLHSISEFLLEIYLDKLIKVVDVLQSDVIYLMEDLSGANGPMLSKVHFDEFVGSYYKRLIPILKEHGVKHIFVDTDGDFTELIPNFLESGVEGFLPLDVNAGVDIVELRKKFPKVKLIGGFNKLSIAAGREEIDKEFERLRPVIRQGGYIPGTDHQVAPSTSLEDYKYYVERLKEEMKQAGRDIK